MEKHGIPGLIFISLSFLIEPFKHLTGSDILTGTQIVSGILGGLYYVRLHWKLFKRK